MSVAVQEDVKYLAGAVGIHLFVALLLIGFNWRSHQAIVPQLAIKGVIVSESVVDALVKSVEAPLPPIEREEKKENKEQEEQKQLLAQAEKKQQLLREQKAAETEQKKQQQEAEKKKAAELQQKKRDAELKRQAELDAKAQKEREAELRAQMAEEEGRANAVNAGLLNQYVGLIRQQVTRNWLKPSTVKPDLSCEVRVTQALGGTVLSVSFGRCNADQAVRTSIENAVLAASPLPAPPDPRVFERTIIFPFSVVDK